MLSSRIESYRGTGWLGDTAFVYLQIAAYGCRIDKNDCHIYPY